MAEQPHPALSPNARPGGMHDSARRRRTQRRGGEKGLWLYVPLEVLEQVGFVRDDPRPWYRTWPGRKRTVLVQLYLEP